MFALLPWLYPQDLVGIFSRAIGSYRGILIPKSHATKTNKIRKYFELYQVFMNYFPYQNVWIFPIYIAYKMNQHILL